MAARSGHTDLPYDLAHLVAEPNQVEWTVNALVQAWSDGRPTTVGPELEAMLARWRALRPGEELAVDWPTRRLPRPSPCSS